MTASGYNLTYNGQVVNFRGVNFNNETATTDITKINVDEADYAQLSAYGANQVRFGISYAWYRTDRTQFFQVLDQHVAWAKQNHLWLVPVLFETPDDCYEGYSHSCQAFWNNDGGLQDKFKAFWVDVASHYANEPTIAGYDILNEPTPLPRQVSVWRNLAQAVHDAILAVDPNHLVVIEEGSSPTFSGSYGPNTLYSTHTYGPASLVFNTTPGKYTYPGQAPDNGVLRMWSKAAFEGQTGDPATNLEARSGIKWAKDHNVPIYIGEDGSEDGTAGYDQLVSDKFSLYNEYGANWSFFVWRSAPHNFGIYPEKGPLVVRDQKLLDAITAQWAGAVKP